MNIPLLMIILYVCFLLGLSVYVSSKQKKEGTNFLLYKGKNNKWVTAVTVAGLAIGGASTVGIAENAVSNGLSAGWYDVAWAFGAICCGLFIVAKFRQTGFSTVSRMVQGMYDKRTAYVVIVTQVLMQCTIIALQYIAGGSILASLLPDIFNLQSGIFFSFLIFMLVGLIGGMGSASLSNILNITLIYVGVIVSTFVILFNRGGLDAALAMAAVSDTPYLSFTAGMGWPAIIAWLVVMVGNCSCVQGVIQIGLTSKTDKDASSGYKIGAFMMIPIGFLCAMMGVASTALHPEVPAAQTLPTIILSLNPFISGITLAALWAADMSTACSMLIGVSTTISQDILQHTPFKKHLEKNPTLTAKSVILISGIVTYILCTKLGTILSAMKVSLALSIGTATIIIAGLWFPRFRSKTAAFLTTITGLIAAALWLTVPELGEIFKDVAYIMLATTLPVFIICNFIFKDHAKGLDVQK